MKRVLLCIAVMILVAGFSGCKKDLTESVDRPDIPGDEENVMNVADSSGDAADGAGSFAVRTIDSEAFRDISWDRCCYREGFLYYGVRVDGDSIFRCDYYVHRLNIDSGEDEELFKAVFEVKENEMIGNINSVEITADGDLRIYCLYLPYDEQTMSDYKRVIKKVYGMDGTEKSSTVLEKDEAVTTESKCMGDGEGNTYIISRAEDMILYMLKYDADGRMVKKMETDDIWYPNSEYVDDSGRLIIRSAAEKSDVYGYVDFEAGQIDNNSFKELNDKGISADIIYDYGGCLLLMDGDWLYSYDTGRNEFSKTIDLKKHDFNGFSVSYFVQMDDDRYLCAFDTSDDGFQEQVIILERSSDSNDNRKVIRLAGIYEDDNGLKLAVNAHNRTDSEYRIEYVSYGMDGEQPVDEMMRDIMTGNIPDIYVLERMNVDNLIAKGMLEDLTPFMEKDEVLNKDYFVDGYLDAAAIDKKQYILMKSFNIYALAGHGKETGSFKDGWTMEEFIKYYSSKPKGTLLFSHTTGLEVFETLMSGSIGMYIDWDNGKCNFDSDSFRNLLEMCYEFRDVKSDSETLNDWPLLLRDGKLLFGTEPVRGPQNIQYNDVIFDDDAVYPGYPSESGSGVYIQTTKSTFAMSSASENKEAAWGILKELMTGDYDRYNYDSDYGIPVSKKEFEKMVAKAVATQKYTAEDGTEIEPQNILYAHYNINIGPADEDVITRLKELIGRAVFRINNNPVLGVMRDDIVKYLDGSRSLDDTVNVIQDKMTKYINENS